MAVSIEDKENWDIVGEYCNKTLRLKADRWLKAVQQPDTRSAVLHLFDKESDQVS